MHLGLRLSAHVRTLIRGTRRLGLSTGIRSVAGQVRRALERRSTTGVAFSVAAETRTQCRTVSSSPLIEPSLPRLQPTEQGLDLSRFGMFWYRKFTYQQVHWRNTEDVIKHGFIIGVAVMEYKRRCSMQHAGSVMGNLMPAPCHLTPAHNAETRSPDPMCLKQ